MGTTDPKMDESSVPATGTPTNPFAGAVDARAIKRGHEEDTYDSKLVLSVPALVVVFFLLAFVTVTIIFWFVSQPQTTPDANPYTVDQNRKPLNERLNEIHLGSPTVNQPRLEPLVERTGDERAITRPPTPTGNSPELHPDDIVPSKENTPELFTTGWVTPDKTYGHITIAEAMKLARSQLKTQKQTVEPLKSYNLPSSANAGRGSGDSVAVPPKMPEEAGGQK